MWGHSYAWSNKTSVDDPKFTDMKELTNPDNFYTMFEDRPISEKPTFMTNNFAERLKIFLANEYTREPYTTFYRRDFLIKGQIFCPNLLQHGDEHFSFKGMCLAKKLLLVPNIWYIVRPRLGSVARQNLNKSADIHKRLRSVIDGFRYFADILDSIKFFSEHPNYRYDVLNWYIQDKSYHLRAIYAKDNPAEIYPLVEKEFTSEEAPFAAYLFNTMKVQQLQIEKLQAELEKFQQQ